MKTSELGGQVLHGWIAKALLEEPGTAYNTSWPGFDQLLEREAIHVAPMPGKAYQWCSIVVGRPEGRLPEGRGPLWLRASGPSVRPSFRLKSRPQRGIT